MLLAHLTLVTLTFETVTPKSIGFLRCLVQMCGPSLRKVGQGVLELLIGNERLQTDRLSDMCKAICPLFFEGGITMRVKEWHIILYTRNLVTSTSSSSSELSSSSASASHFKNGSALLWISWATALDTYFLDTYITTKTTMIGEFASEISTVKPHFKTTPLSRPPF